MLSSDAERLYWMARYLERAEDMARMINAFSHLILDLPKGAELDWDVLIKTIDAEADFNVSYRTANEANIIRYLLADEDNSSSIRRTIFAARENVRTTRDVLPAQAWELMNEYHLFVDQMAAQSIARRNRFQFLEGVIGRNQQLNGLIHTTVTRDHSMFFIRLGQFMERSDMTSRIVDVGTAAIGERMTLQIPELPLLWSNLLKSLSATAAYRRLIGPVVSAPHVIDFVLKANRFPRSLIYCVNEIEETFGQLKAPSGMFRGLRAIAQAVNGFDASGASLKKLHRFIDWFQLELAEVHEATSEHWFFTADL